MLAYDRHFSNPVIGGTGHAQRNIWSYCHGKDCVSQVKSFDPALEEKKAQRHTFDKNYILSSLKITIVKELLQILD